ncbi:hypothetical protein Taro_042281 [Colocasia esculenta]|uniref:Uncharacterized protein n=1 Tax=Colocasia esculenta TaxID=4460 RepID=A0A843X2A1_COLES|nr:hypothetical protein [Colocasia esculenta]
MSPPGSQIAAAVAAASGGLTPGDRRVLAAVNVGASSLSLVGSAFIVLCYLLFKELRKFSFKLIFFLALSDMLSSFFTIVGWRSKKGMNGRRWQSGRNLPLALPFRSPEGGVLSEKKLGQHVDCYDAGKWV